MPFVAIAMIFMIGTIGISTDLMSDFQAAQELEYSAQQAALYGESFAFQLGADGLNNAARSKLVIESRITGAGNQAFSASSLNHALAGPKNNEQPVTFAAGDVAYVQNPLDGSESFLQVTARRGGGSSLKQFFWPVFYTSLGSSAPQNQITVNSQQTVQVFAQVATRIGPGAPVTTVPAAPGADFLYTGTFPIAVRLSDFQALAARSPANTLCTLNFPGAPGGTVSGSNVLNACFVNLTPSGGVPYYNGSSGLAAVEQLEQLLSYFSGGLGATAATAPAACEVGSQLYPFNPNDATFQGEIANIQNRFTALQSLPAQSRSFIVPVVDAIDSAGFINPSNVVGFALLRLNQLSAVKGQPVSGTVYLCDSQPMLNASCGTGFYSLPPSAGLAVKAPVFPFIPRAYDPIANGVPPRLAGITLAPSLTPTNIKLN